MFLNGLLLNCKKFFKKRQKVGGILFQQKLLNYQGKIFMFQFMNLLC